MSKSGRRILFLAHTQSIHTKRWVEYFIRKNWEVHIISFQPDVIAGAINYHLAVGEISASGNNFKYLKKLPRIILLTYRIKPNIINAHYLTSFGLLAYLTFYKKICITLQGSDVFLFSQQNKLYKFFSRRILKKALHVFSVSDTMTQYVCSRFGLDTTHITTIQYGIDTDLFRNIKSYQERNYTFITNRAFVNNSNYPIILKLMYQLKEENVNYSMLVVGNGPLKNKINEMIEQYCLSDQVTLMNAVQQVDLVRLLNDAKFYISFTHSDGTPLSLFEAAACGLYPILSANDANKEWIGKGLKGVCINLTDLAETIKIIKSSLNSIEPGKYQSYNYEFVKKHMSYTHNMAIIENKIASLI